MLHVPSVVAVVTPIDEARGLLPPMTYRPKIVFLLHYSISQLILLFTLSFVVVYISLIK
jgi:hypothetical protein